MIGSADGFGFNGGWQNFSSSQGTATNTAAGLSYTDGLGRVLVTSGGAGLFQGLTTADNSMQPIRLFNFGRGTNGTDGVTTWISFVATRQGPVVAGNNPFPRGANVPHDLNAGSLQKLAVGNSTGAAKNTIGLVPTSSAGNLKRSEAAFSQTNFIVVRVDHAAGAVNDNAYLFVNPASASNNFIENNNPVQQSNSWNLAVTPDAADYVRFLETAAKALRNPDGSFPTGFARLVSGSDLIDKGVDVGIPFNGSAPDLGPHEYAP